MLPIAVALVLAGPVIGDPAPPIELPRPPEVEATVVDFFATWCLPCRRSLEDLTAVRQALGPRVQVVILAVEGDIPAVHAFFHDHPPPEGARVTFSSSEVQRRWGADRLPTSFFLDRALVVRHINRGHGPGYRARATRWLTTMLEAAR